MCAADRGPATALPPLPSGRHSLLCLCSSSSFSLLLDGDAGIASILPDTAPGALLEHSSYPEEAAVPEADRPLLARFLSTSRINLNVRQVRVHKERAEGGE